MKSRKSLKRRLPTGSADCIDIDDVTDDAILMNLKIRYEMGHIYSYIGESLVSVNPYETQNIYGNEMIEEYYNSQVYQNPPHIYSIGNTALQIIRKRQKMAAVILLGESGSGKTTAALSLKHFITKSTLPTSTSDPVPVRRLLIHSSPILESFGHASAKRNYNSSRYVLHTRVHFNFNGEPIGGEIMPYLYENSRINSYLSDDRSFHIFFQLLSCGDKALLRQLNLTSDPKDYKSLMEKFIRKDDKEGYLLLREALESMGISATYQVDILKVVAAVLHLGQISFDTDSSTNTASVSNINLVTPVATQLGVRVDNLLPLLLNRSTSTKSGTASTKMNMEQAEANRNFLSRIIFEKLFYWLVHRINSQCKVQNSKSTTKASLSILDPHGFESAENNYLDQLIINYTAEKLQNNFIVQELVEQQEEYFKEGIPWINIDLSNNDFICKAIGDPITGILSTLEKQTGKTEIDYEVLVAMDTNLGKVSTRGDVYSSNGTGDQSLHRDHEFMLKHQNGSIIYSTRGFLNLNTIHNTSEIKKTLGLSKSHLVKEMQTLEMTQSMSGYSTMTSNVETSLKSLISSLSQTEKLYVHCIRPNSTKTSMKMVDSIVSSQIKALNLNDQVKIRKGGYPYYEKYEDFIERYKSLCPSTWPTVKYSKEGTTTLIKHLDIKESVRYGKTKIFLKEYAVYFDLEEKRTDVIPKLTLLIQRTYRGFVGRMIGKRVRSVYYLMSCFKRYKLRKMFRSVYNAFKDVEQMDDLGKSVVWPTPPPSLRLGLSNMMQIHKSWRASKLLKGFTPEQIEEIKLKCAAYSALYGQKSDWGLHYMWLGDDAGKHLNSKLISKYQKSVTKLLKKLGDTTVYWSGKVTKPTSSLKNEEFTLLITDKHLLALDGSKFEINNKSGSIPFGQIVKLSFFPGPDQVVVVHLNQKIGDLILIMPPKRSAGEFLGCYIVAARGVEVTTPLEVAPTIQVNHDGKSKELVVIDSAVDRPMFQKGTKNQVVIAWVALTE